MILVPDVIYEIFKYLELKDIYNVLQSNSYLLNCTKEERLWYNICSSFNKYKYPNSYKIQLNKPNYYETVKAINKLNNFNKILNEDRYYIYDDQNNTSFYKTEILDTYNLNNIETQIKISKDGFELNRFPEEILYFKNLQKIFLSDCGIPEIPNNISVLMNLKVIGLSRNEIKEIPDSLCTLTGLESLFFDNNKLVHLPNNFGKLTNLRELYFYKNSLIDMPDSLTQLTNLKCLDLSSNKLEHIPEGLNNLNNLQSLNLGFNNLTTIDPSLSLLNHLQFISLNNNPIEIPEEIRDMKMIRKQFNYK
jgi:Leucine-rich repeat (LRR) protein